MADFWTIIDHARGAGSPATPSASPEALKKVLSEMPTAEVQDFMREFTRRQCDLNRWDLWAAGYVICGGMSDDSFHYFRDWIIGKGRACFEIAIKDPSGLIPYLDNVQVDNELLEYVAPELLESRGVDYDPSDTIDVDPDDDPSGEPFDEDSVSDQYPELARFAAQFGQSQDPNPKPPASGFLQSIWDRLRSRRT